MFFGVFLHLILHNQQNLLGIVFPPEPIILADVNQSKDK
jgi:hypothetical protein